MGRGESITDVERGQVEALLSQGLSYRNIGKEIGRSEKLVRDCVSRGVQNPPGKSSGRKRKLSDIAVRHIRRDASNSETSAAKIKRDLDLDVSESTVLRAIHGVNYLQHEHKLVKPAITNEIKQQRYEFAVEHVQWTSQWDRVIFSDEKKFNLDGPDGLAHYWHDLRKEPLLFSKRQHGGGTVMVWVGFSRDFKCQLHFIGDTLNAKKYQQILQSKMLPVYHTIDARYNAAGWFQQDNATPHTANTTEEWFTRHGIDLLGSPTKSPDLNPTENIFGILARRVYADNRQFSSVDELRHAIAEVWNNMSQAELAGILQSMNSRMVEVIANHGKATHY